MGNRFEKSKKISSCEFTNDSEQRESTEASPNKKNVSVFSGDRDVYRSQSISMTSRNLAEDFFPSIVPDELICDYVMNQTDMIGNNTMVYIHTRILVILEKENKELDRPMLKANVVITNHPLLLRSSKKLISSEIIFHATLKILSEYEVTKSPDGHIQVNRIPIRSIADQRATICDLPPVSADIKASLYLLSDSNAFRNQLNSKIKACFNKSTFDRQSFYCSQIVSIVDSARANAAVDKKKEIIFRKLPTTYDICKTPPLYLQPKWSLSGASVRSRKSTTLMEVSEELRPQESNSVANVMSTNNGFVRQSPLIDLKALCHLRFLTPKKIKLEDNVHQLYVIKKTRLGTRKNSVEFDWEQTIDEAKKVEELNQNLQMNTSSSKNDIGSGVSQSVPTNLKDTVAYCRSSPSPHILVRSKMISDVKPVSDYNMYGCGGLYILRGSVEIVISCIYSFPDSHSANGTFCVSGEDIFPASVAVTVSFETWGRCDMHNCTETIAESVQECENQTSVESQRARISTVIDICIERHCEKAKVCINIPCLREKNLIVWKPRLCKEQVEAVLDILPEETPARSVTSTTCNTEPTHKTVTVSINIYFDDINADIVRPAFVEEQLHILKPMIPIWAPVAQTHCACQSFALMHQLDVHKAQCVKIVMLTLEEHEEMFCLHETCRAQIRLLLKPCSCYLACRCCELSRAGVMIEIPEVCQHLCLENPKIHKSHFCPAEAVLSFVETILRINTSQALYPLRIHPVRHLRCFTRTEETCEHCQLPVKAYQRLVLNLGFNMCGKINNLELKSAEVNIKVPAGHLQKLSVGIEISLSRPVTPALKLSKHVQKCQTSKFNLQEEFLNMDMCGEKTLCDAPTLDEYGESGPMEVHTASIYELDSLDSEEQRQGVDISYEPLSITIEASPYSSESSRKTISRVSISSFSDPMRSSERCCSFCCRFQAQNKIKMEDEEYIITSNLSPNDETVNQFTERSDSRHKTLCCCSPINQKQKNKEKPKYNGKIHHENELARPSMCRIESMNDKLMFDQFSWILCQQKEDELNKSIESNEIMPSQRYVTSPTIQTPLQPKPKSKPPTLTDCRVQDGHIISCKEGSLFSNPSVYSNPQQKVSLQQNSVRSPSAQDESLSPICSCCNCLATDERHLKAIADLHQDSQSLKIRTPVYCCGIMKHEKESNSYRIQRIDSMLSARDLQETRNHGFQVLSPHEFPRCVGIVAKEGVYRGLVSTVNLQKEPIVSNHFSASSNDQFVIKSTKVNINARHCYDAQSVNQQHDAELKTTTANVNSVDVFLNNLKKRPFGVKQRSCYATVSLLDALLKDTVKSVRHCNVSCRQLKSYD